jgi:archaeal cell division control protein 6
LSSKIIEETLRTPTIIKDERKLSIDYVPIHLPHREKEIRRLTHMFRSLLAEPGAAGQRIILAGPVGTGKTAVSKLFGERMSQLAKEQAIKLDYQHFNCHKERTLFNIIRKLALNYCPTLPDRGFSAGELFSLVRDYLEENNTHLVICLDEVNFLVKTSNDDPLYFLTRSTEERLNPSQRINLIVISRNRDFIRELDESTRSTLMNNIIPFEHYTHEQLRDILEERARDALHEGTYDDDTLEIITENGENAGDARYVLELLWRASKYADEQSSERILPEHVRLAAADVSLHIHLEDLEAVPRPELLVLLGIVRALKANDKAHVTTSEMEDTYRIVCEEFEEKPRGHAQLFEYLQNLNSMDIIITRPSGPGFRGRTTLIGLPDIPLSILEREIIRLYEKGAAGDENFV